MADLPRNLDEALARGWVDFPSERKDELNRGGTRERALARGVDCNNPANEGAVCGQYTDADGNPVVSVCTDGFCERRFLRAPG